MSAVLWCDIHDGPFSAMDIHKRQMTESRTVKDGHFVQTVTATVDICGECAPKAFNHSAKMLDKGIAQDEEF